MSTGKKVLNGINKFYALMTGLGTIVVAIWLISSWLGIDVQSKIENAVGPGKQYIEGVKGGILYQYSDKPIGEVFDHMYSDPSLKYRESNGKHFVDFTGMYHSAEGNHEMKSSFEMFDNGTFEVSYVAVDGGLLNQLEGINYLTGIFNDYNWIRQSQ